jgi:hypothetical protein
MAEHPQPEPLSEPASPERPAPPSHRLREVRRAAPRVLALTLLLATVLEVLLAGAAMLTGQAQSGARPFVLDWLEKLPWALIVCVGAWVGLEAGGGKPLVLGLAGLLAAPTASLAARTAAQALQATALGAGPVAQSTYYAPAAPAGPSPFAIAGLRAAEYLCLGLVVGWLVRRAGAGPHHHAAVGLGVGAIFGAGLLALNAAASGGPLVSPAAMPAWVINELLFPAGCALILFSVRPPEAGPAAETETTSD